MKKPKVRTMEELSVAIGVSRPTLSRFFQDSKSVRKSTRLRIEQALEGVDYVPNFFATRLNRKSTKLIGAVIPHWNDLFFTSLVEAIESCALRSEYTVITQNSHGDPKLEARAVENLISMSADGAIFAPIGHASELSSFARLKDEMPLVFVDSHFPGEFEDVDFVGTNNRQSIGLIVDYLCRSGEPPVFLGMPKLNSNSFERERAYIDRMAKKNLPNTIIPGLPEPSGWSFETLAYQLMDSYFARGEYVDRTILCANDRMAIGVIRAAHRHRLFDRSDNATARLRIAGHDDHPLSAFVYPELTTVLQDIRAIGEAAVGQLLAQIGVDHPSGRLGVTRVFDAELRVRDSA